MRPVQDVDVLSDEPTPANRGLVVAAAVAAVVIVLDQLTKRWAIQTLGAGSCGADPDNCIDLFWTLRFNLVENPGAAFSTGVGLGPLFAVIAAVMTVVLFNAARTRTDRVGPALLGLIGGGAIGNLIDRIVRAEDGIGTGKVIDFIDFQWWPIFNVADMGVVVGVVCFIVFSLFEAPPEAEPAEGIDHGDADLDSLDDADLVEEIDPDRRVDADLDSALEFDDDLDHDAAEHGPETVSERGD